MNARTEQACFRSAFAPAFAPSTRDLLANHALAVEALEANHTRQTSDAEFDAKLALRLHVMEKLGLIRWELTALVEALS